MRKLRIHDAATLEASEAAIWYERERTGLGAEFEQAIDRALDVLEQDVVPLATMPGAAGKRGAKKLLLKRFPYAVIVRSTRLKFLSLRLLISRSVRGIGSVD